MMRGIAKWDRQWSPFAAEDLIRERRQCMFRCPVCAKPFDTERELVEHKSTHDATRPQRIVLRQVGRPRWNGNNTTFTFVRLELNSRPTKKVQDTLHHCPICAVGFDSEDVMLEHEMTHLEEVGRPGGSDRAPQKTSGLLADQGNETVPFSGERLRWTTGIGSQEGGELTGRETPGGRNAGFSSD